jgi:phosphate:Na+ symporter
MTIDAVLSLLAGLGLFFIGVKNLRVTMGQMTGRRMQHWVSRAASHPVFGAVIGALSGALTQSTNAVTIILVSLAQTGLLGAADAAPILAWSNVGTSLLVFAAAISLHLFIFALLAISGLCFYLNLDRAPRWRPLVSVLFAVALIFFGLEIMRSTSGGMNSGAWSRDFLASEGRTVPTAIAAGAAMAILVQSSATVGVVVTALAAAGISTLDQSTLVVFGACFGSGIASFFVGFKLSGRPRHLPQMQSLFKILGVVLLVPLYVAERIFDLPLLLHGARALSDSPARQVALVYLACQLAAVVVQIVFGRAILPWLERVTPPTPEEDLSRPRFIYNEALKEPETALTLVDREQARIFRLLPVCLGFSSHLDEIERRLDRNAILPVAAALLEAVRRFLDDLADSGANRDLLDRAADRRSCNDLLVSIHESMNELAGILAQPFATAAMRSLVENIVEGLTALLFTANDAVSGRDREDIALLRQFTSDRGSLVEALRRRVMTTDQGLSSEDRASLYALTSLLERIVWMLGRYGRLLDSQLAADSIDAGAPVTP